MALSISPPPIDGRGKRVHAIVKAELESIRDELERLDQDITKKKFELKPDEKTVIDQLIDFDRKAAVRAKEAGLNLPLAPLDAAARVVMSSVKDRLSDYFEMNQEEQLAAEVFEAEWTHHYSAEFAKADAVFKQREEDQKKKVEQEAKEKLEQAEKERVALEAEAKAVLEARERERQEAKAHEEQEAKLKDERTKIQLEREKLRAEHEKASSKPSVKAATEHVAPAAKKSEEPKIDDKSR